MKKFILATLVLLSFGSSVSYAQTTPMKPSAAEMDRKRDSALLDIQTTRQPLPKDQFIELVYTDFTKLLQAGGTTGKPINFASLDLAKPKGTVNYTIGPRTNKKWFINLGASGGFEDDIISLIENQKPAKSYSGNVSFSKMLFPKYYFGDENFALKDQIKKNYKELYVSDYEKAMVEYLKLKMAASSKILVKAYSTLELAIKNNQPNVDSEKTAILTELDNFNSFRIEREDLEKSIVDRTAKLDKIYQEHAYRSKHLFWFTVNQKTGGSKFRFYDSLLPENTIKNGKSSRSTYQTSLTGNYYYKNVFRNFRLLSSLGLAAGSFNNFDELTGSEFKTTAKKEVGADSYTKSDAYTVYEQSDFKSYHALKAHIELYSLFSKTGNFGVRGKYVFDMPYGEDKTNLSRRRAQQDAEVGLIFNTISKAEEKKEASPISFELYYRFTDINGSQPNATGKAYKRNEIGIKTAIPFNL